MYTISVLKGGLAKRDKLALTLQAAIAKDGRFRVGDFSVGNLHSRNEDSPAIYLQRIRLTHKKEYCGNHPGNCIINPFRGAEKKKITSYLEWDDWVAFHSIVNRVCNRLRVDANIWTLPQDVQGKMWIRKGTQARVRYDYTETFNNFGLPIRHWNTGTPDQFQPEDT